MPFLSGCAAVSALVQTMALWLHQTGAVIEEERLEPGDALLRFAGLVSRDGWDFLRLGLLGVAAGTLAALEDLAQRHDVTAIMSESAYWTDTRFGDAADFVLRLGQLTGKPVLHTLAFSPSKCPV